MQVQSKAKLSALSCGYKGTSTNTILASGGEWRSVWPSITRRFVSEKLWTAAVATSALSTDSMCPQTYVVWRSESGAAGNPAAAAIAARQTAMLASSVAQIVATVDNAGRRTRLTLDSGGGGRGGVSTAAQSDTLYLGAGDGEEADDAGAATATGLDRTVA